MNTSPELGRVQIALVGAGGHALDLAETIWSCQDQGDRIDLVGVIIDPGFDGHRLGSLGVSVLASPDEVGSIEAELMLAIGYPGPRSEFLRRLGPGARYCRALVHPAATVGRMAELGIGSAVLGNAHLSAGVRVGEHTHIGYLSALGHGTVVGNVTSIMPGAIVGGDVEIGDRTLVGSGAIVREGCRIGSDATIAAGAVVLDDVADGTVVMGVPATTRRSDHHGSGGAAT